jgi:hypothetical protein
MADCHCARAEALAQFQNTLFKIVGIFRIRLSPRRLQLWNLAAVAVFFNEFWTRRRLISNCSATSPVSIHNKQPSYISG